MLSAFDLWILILETRTLWVLIVENVRLTEVNFTCTCGSLWFSDSAVYWESVVTEPKWHNAVTTGSLSTQPTKFTLHYGIKWHTNMFPRVGRVWCDEEKKCTHENSEQRKEVWAVKQWVESCPLRFHAFDCNMSDRIMECHSASSLAD